MKFPTAIIALALAASAYSCTDPVRHDGVNPNYVRTSEAYSYAPDSINGTAFYCAGDYGVTDNIVMNRGGRETTVLTPTRGAWDSAHVCDPAVVKGDFSLNGTPYQWAMAYTGTADPHGNGSNNSIGLAFSNDMVDWTKRAAPFAAYQGSASDSRNWGVLQPWMTAEGDGQVLIVYTGAGSNGHIVRHADLSNTTDDGGIEVLDHWSPPTAGLNPVEHGQPLANADVAYEVERDRFWIVKESYYSRALTPTFIAEQVEVAWLPAADFRAGTGTWTSIGGIDIESTGKLKNHNAAFETGPWGYVNRDLRVLVTTSHTQAWPQNLWEYRIYSIDLNT